MTRIATGFGPPDLPCRIAARTLVVAQLGQSLDGRIATLTGASKYINGTGALDHLHRLRAQVDAVIVGVGTICADDPQLTVRRCAGAHPVRVVLDPAGRMPTGAKCLTDGDGAVLVIVASGASAPAGAEAVELPCGPGGFAPAAILAALAARGLSRVLVGGADTLARFIDAGAVDLLHVLVAPMILGSGKPGFSLAPIDTLDEAMRPRASVHMFDDGDVLFACDLRRFAS
jgi:diaminohydroxyphosphoribosylaminopyrimidine deaminase/5-amino-6-(5-phosphoribosylamino)uracil reductase